MDKIDASQRLVANVATATFKPFYAGGDAIKGQSYFQFDETFPKGCGFHLYRMEPGSTSQPHEHTCHEQFFVLDGEVVDHDGYVYKPGDFVLLKQGTRHSSHTKTGATLVVFIRSLEENL